MEGVVKAGARRSGFQEMQVPSLQSGCLQRPRLLFAQGHAGVLWQGWESSCVLVSKGEHTLGTRFCGAFSCVEALWFEAGLNLQFPLVLGTVLTSCCYRHPNGIPSDLVCGFMW